MVDARAGLHTAGILVVALCLGGESLQAQLGPEMGASGPPRMAPAIGARAGYDVDAKAWSVGGQLRYGILPGLAVVPSADFFLSEDASDWQVNLDGALAVLPFLYAGGGLALARDSLPGSSAPKTEFAYNLLVGLQAPLPNMPLVPFAEARWTAVNRVVNPFRIVAGLSVSLGRSDNRRR